MAFALMNYWEGTKHYIHKDYGRGDNSPYTTINMNFALLFVVESDARKWARRNGIDNSFVPQFIPINIKTEIKADKKYYTTLRELKKGENVDDLLPF